MPDEERFVSEARRFVSLIQGFEARTRDELVRDVEAALVRLYASALELERREDGDDAEVAPMNSQDAWDLFQRLGEHLGRIDAYSLAFDPFDLEAKPVVALLSDDLVDIYRDLLEGLDLYDSGHPGEATWQWRLGSTTIGVATSPTRSTRFGSSAPNTWRKPGSALGARHLPGTCLAPAWHPDLSETDGTVPRCA